MPDRNEYLPRLLDTAIERRFASFGAMEVSGAKFCGKTWASMAHANSIVHIDDEAVRQMVEVDASLALEGAQPQLLPMLLSRAIFPRRFLVHCAGCGGAAWRMLEWPGCQRTEGHPYDVFNADGSR